jgi:hypothetical protein
VILAVLIIPFLATARRMPAKAVFSHVETRFVSLWHFIPLQNFRASWLVVEAPAAFLFSPMVEPFVEPNL